MVNDLLKASPTYFTMRDMIKLFLVIMLILLFSLDFFAKLSDKNPTGLTKTRYE